MKTTLQSIILFLISITIHSQDIQWERTLGGEHAEYLYDAIPTLDYGLILVGSSLSDKTGDASKNQGDFDYFICKLDEQGATEWVTHFGGNGVDLLKSINRTYDGGYILAGTSSSEASADKTTAKIGQEDIWIVKLDMKGVVQWQKSLGGIAEEQIAVIKPTLDGGYILGGSSSSDAYISPEDEPKSIPNLGYKTDNSKGSLDYWLVKLDIMGEIEWQKTYGGRYVDQLRQVVEIPEKGFVIAGVSNSPMEGDKLMETKGYNDWWVLSLDEKGNEKWQKSYGTSADDQLFSMIYTKENELILGGSFSESDQEEETGHTESDFVVLKLDLEGKQIWEKSFDIGTHDFLTDLVYNRDGSILLSGYSASESSKSLLKSSNKEGIEDYVAIKIDTEGEELWRKIIGSKQKEVLTRTIETRDGGYVLLGTSMPLKGEGTNNANYYIVKLRDQDKPIVEKAPLEAFPNPTKEFTAVVLGYDYESGTCTVVDLNGRQLQSFDIKTNRTIPVNLKNYPDGMYIIHVKTEVGENSVKVMKVSKR